VALAAWTRPRTVESEAAGSLGPCYGPQHRPVDLDRALDRGFRSYPALVGPVNGRNPLAGKGRESGPQRIALDSATCRFGAPVLVRGGTALRCKTPGFLNGALIGGTAPRGQTAARPRR
jgi:hypothetical protein